MRGNLRVHLSDAVHVSKMEKEVKTAKKITVAPYADTIEGLKVRQGSGGRTASLPMGMLRVISCFSSCLRSSLPLLTCGRMCACRATCSRPSWSRTSRTTTAPCAPATPSSPGVACVPSSSRCGAVVDGQLLLHSWEAVRLSAAGWCLFRSDRRHRDGGRGGRPVRHGR